MSTTPEILAAASERDPRAVAVVTAAGRALGLGIAELVNLLDPQAVVIGGGLGSTDGPYGQVLTNLIFNAVTHGFTDGPGGHMLIKARRLGMEQVEITFSDDGKIGRAHV